MQTEDRRDVRTNRAVRVIVQQMLHSLPVGREKFRLSLVIFQLRSREFLIFAFCEDLDNLTCKPACQRICNGPRQPRILCNSSTWGRNRDTVCFEHRREERLDRRTLSCEEKGELKYNKCIYNAISNATNFSAATTIGENCNSFVIGEYM